MKKANLILIAGAGEAGRTLLEEFQSRGLLASVAGLVDDDESKAGFSLFGKSVLGSTEDIPRIASELGVRSVVIAMPSVSAAAVKNLTGKILAAGLRISILPAGERYFDSVPLLPSLADVSVSELLDREEYSLDIEAIRSALDGKRILITGAGGSIGSEICRQLLKFPVSSIAAVGRGEFSMYSLIRSMEEYTDFMPSSPRIIYKIGDIKDETTGDLFGELRPDIVFHAAAHKHVPLMEYNEPEAFRNNVLGTLNALSFAADSGASVFVLVSTDKAVRPSSVMGATKRAAEMVTAAFCGKNGLRTSAVRFGNVLGSRGSVVPLFQEQIKRGGPVTVTHPDVSRYFMTVQEAALLVINACALTRGGETFVLDMGKPCKLADMASRLIELYGLVPGRDIHIEYTGLRPGEKLSEEIFHGDTDLERTSNSRILVKRSDPKELPPDLFNMLPSLREHLSPQETRNLLKRIVPDYNESPRSEQTSRIRYVS